jgi:phage-related holin
MNELALFGWIREAAIFIWGVWFVKVLVFHVLLNLGVGVAAAIYTNEFSFGKVGEFLYRKLLPFVLVLIFAEAFSPALGIDWLSKSVWVLIEMTLIGDLMGSLKKLGVPIPDRVSSRFVS